MLIIVEIVVLTTLKNLRSLKIGIRRKQVQNINRKILIHNNSSIFRRIFLNFIVFFEKCTLSSFVLIATGKSNMFPNRHVSRTMSQAGWCSVLCVKTCRDFLFNRCSFSGPQEIRNYSSLGWFRYVLTQKTSHLSAWLIGLDTFLFPNHSLGLMKNESFRRYCSSFTLWSTAVSVSDPSTEVFANESCIQHFVVVENPNEPCQWLSSRISCKGCENYFSLQNSMTSNDRKILFKCWSHASV